MRLRELTEHARARQTLLGRDLAAQDSLAQSKEIVGVTVSAGKPAAFWYDCSDEPTWASPPWVTSVFRAGKG